MGEVSQLKVSVPKPRPLGLVKRESVHFDEGSEADVLFSAGKHDSWTRGSLAFLGRSKTESDIKHEFRSMRDLQETLRQAALLNIVAAVNHDDTAVDTMPAVTRTGGSHFVGIKGASILGHTIARPSIHKALVPTTTTSEGIQISNFSHNLSSTTPAVSSMPVASQNSTLSQLLGQRPRTISIPRPRTQSEQGAFMHNSLLDAKEQLSNVTTFRAKSRRELDPPFYSFTPASVNNKDLAADATTDEPKIGSTHGDENEPKKVEFVREVSCLRGTGFDIGGESNHHHHHSKSNKDTSSQNVFTKDNNNGGNHNADNTNSGRLSKDQQRVQNVHQMQAMKRHISTSKKKEMMKKLTDIAKCDAVDMAEPLSSADAVSAPPIIIMSQQKENSPLHADGFDTRVNRTKSMTSLNERGEDSNVPSSHNRIQSETLESMATYREAKRRGILNVEEDLRIESINGFESAKGVDSLYRTNREQKGLDFGEDNVYVPYDSRTDVLFSEGIIGKTVPPSFSPDVLELRPLDTYANVSHRLTLADRRRQNVPRRAAANHQVVRDKLISPSPAVYEASFHRPKVHMTLVGQSLSSLAGTKTPAAPPLIPTKQVTKRISGEFDSRPHEETPQNKPGGEGKAVPLKPWGSIGKQPSVNSPILRTEILDHLQCVGLVNNRTIPEKYRKNVSKATSINNKSQDYHNRPDAADFDDDEEFFYDDDDGSDSPQVTKNTAKYRKSKLYNAFRASEENLSTLADNTSLVSEVMTSRTLLNPQHSTVVEETVGTSSREPEPLYMGCSSRVSERELRSQYHVVSDQREEESGQNSSQQFKVMKAIDQDVYFDFQHKKYRKNNESALNTAPNNPRMHFLKIKFNEETKT